MKPFGFYHMFWLSFTNSTLFTRRKNCAREKRIQHVKIIRIAHVKPKFLPVKIFRNAPVKQNFLPVKKTEKNQKVGVKNKIMGVKNLKKAEKSGRENKFLPVKNLKK